MTRVFVHDPNAVEDYTFDWRTEFLASSENIASSVWAVSPAGPVLSGSAFTNDTATIFMGAGAVAGEVYVLSNKITTNQGRTDERSITVRTEER